MFGTQDQVSTMNQGPKNVTLTLREKQLHNSSWVGVKDWKGVTVSQLRTSIELGAAIVIKIISNAILEATIALHAVINNNN